MKGFVVLAKLKKMSGLDAKHDVFGLAQDFLGDLVEAQEQSLLLVGAALNF